MYVYYNVHNIIMAQFKITQARWPEYLFSIS